MPSPIQAENVHGEMRVTNLLKQSSAFGHHLAIDLRQCVNLVPPMDSPNTA